MCLGFPNELVGVDRAGEASSQGALGQLIELPEQGALPRIPDLRVRAANICNRQHVEITQVRLVPYGTSELIDDSRIVQVLLLGGHG